MLAITFYDSLEFRGSELFSKHESNVSYSGLEKNSILECFNSLVSSFKFRLISHEGIFHIVDGFDMRDVGRIFYNLDDKLVHSLFLLLIIDKWLEHAHVKDGLFILYSLYFTIDAIPKSPYPDEIVILIPKTCSISCSFELPYFIIFEIN